MKAKFTIMLLFSINWALAQEVSYEYPFSEENLINRSLDQELYVGKTPSTYAVSPAGAFNYSIPIRIPKGTQNMEPKIDLNYSSQAGNGIAGYGWGISGLSIISRVNRDHFHEGHAANVLHYPNDPMAWDGNRLILVEGEYGQDGSKYKTEAETFTEIRLHGQFGSGADWLEVETKEGIIMEYGRNPDAKVLSHDGFHVIAWKISKSKDRFGNYIEYLYENRGQENLVKRISYTGNESNQMLPYAHINFYYGERSDKNLLYASEYGQRLERNYLLEKIEVTYGEDNQSYKRYELKYSNPFYSYLNEVLEFGKLGSLNHYNSLRFSYHEAEHQFSVASTGINPGAADLFTADFNGDGIDDILRAYKSFQGNTKSYHAYDLLLNSSNGFQSPIPLNLPTGKILQAYPNSPIAQDNGLLYFGIGDFNGDAKMDIYISQAALTPNNMHMTSVEIWYAQVQNNSLSFNYAAYPVPNFSNIGKSNAITVGDFNGDGADDIYCNLHDGHKADFGEHEDNYFYPVIYAPLLSLNPLAVHGIVQTENHKFSMYDIVYTLDMNGDSKRDLMQVYEHADQNKTVVKTFHYYTAGYFTVEYIYVDDRGPSEYANFPSKAHVLRFGDFNGDGKTDLLSSSNSDRRNWTIHLSSGQAFVWLANLALDADDVNELLSVADLNGDGKSDILLSSNIPGATNTNLDIYYLRGANMNTGADLVAHNETFLGVISVTHPHQFLDYDGDGAMELLTCEQISSPMQMGDFSLDNNFGQLEAISTGFNELVQVKYNSIADPKDPCRALYSQDSQENYPLIDFHRPLFVVGELEFPDQSGKNGKSLDRVKHRYYYRNAKLHRQGKGLLGFEVVEYDEIQLDGQEQTIFLHHDFYEFDRQYYFSRLAKSHQSVIAYDGHDPNDPNSSKPCLTARAILKNWTSKEMESHTISLSGGRFINQLVRTKEGDNLIGFTQETEFIYNSQAASLAGNPDQVIESRAAGRPEQEITIRDFSYGQYGTILPAAITQLATSRTRGNKPSFNTLMQYDYDQQTGAMSRSKVLNPSTLVPLIEKTFTYDPNFGNKVQEYVQVANHANPNRISSYVYDAEGRFIIKKTNPLGYEEQWEYDKLSALPITYNDPLPNNKVAEFSNDDFHRLVQKKDEWGNLESTSWGFEVLPGGQLSNPEASLYWKKVESSTSGISKQWYDHNARSRKAEQEGFNQKVYQVLDYTAKGNVLRQTDPFFASQLENSTSYNYDEYGRKISEFILDKNGILKFSHQFNPVAHTGIQVPYQYTNRNVTNSSTRADGFQVVQTNDASGRTIRQTDPAGTMEYEYESSGQLSKTWLNGELMAEIVYDELGFQISLEEANSGLNQYSYNALGELVESTDASGNQSRGMIYDALGRLIKKEVIDLSFGNKTYEYEYSNSGNSRGQLTEAKVIGGISYNYDYDEYGNLIYEEENLAGKQYISDYEYDIHGRLLESRNRRTASKNRWQYTSTGFVDKVFHEFNEEEKLVFEGSSQNARGQWTAYQQLGNVNCIKSYDAFGNPTSIASPGIFEEQYAWNTKNKNLEFRENVLSSTRESFTYDAIDRLKEVDLNGQTTLSMNYSSNGNIRYKSDIGNYTYHAGMRNAVLEVDNFNSAIETTRQNIEFNAQHDPEVIIENNQELRFEYGPFHQRKIATFIDQQTGAKSFRHYSHAGEFLYDQQYQELFALEYLNGEDGIAAIKVREREDPGMTAIYAVHKDYLGSWNVLSDETGQKFCEQSFDVWGRYRNPSDWEVRNNFQPAIPNWLYRGYTGHEHLETYQLIHMNGRLQDPYLGRMLSPDNYVVEPGNTQSYNRFSYVNNNPLKFYDPDGEFLTWSIHSHGFSLGVNYTPIGIGAGGGINVGWGDGYSTGLYGELGYRLGGTGFGAGSTISQNVNYNFKYSSISTTSTFGLYASIGPLNIGGSYSSSYDLTNRIHQGYSWGVSAGVGLGNEKGGIGLYAGISSNGINYGIGAYYDPRVKLSDYNVIITANDDGTYSEKLATPDFEAGSSVLKNSYATNLQDNPNVVETMNSDGSYTYKVNFPRRHRIDWGYGPETTKVRSWEAKRGCLTFVTNKQTPYVTFTSARPYSSNYFNFRNYNTYRQVGRSQQPRFINIFGNSWF